MLYWGRRELEEESSLDERAIFALNFLCFWQFIWKCVNKVSSTKNIFILKSCTILNVVSRERRQLSCVELKIFWSVSARMILGNCSFTKNVNYINISLSLLLCVVSSMILSECTHCTEHRTLKLQIQMKFTCYSMRRNAIAAIRIRKFYKFTFTSYAQLR